MVSHIVCSEKGKVEIICFTLLPNGRFVVLAVVFVAVVVSVEHV